MYTLKEFLETPVQVLAPGPDYHCEICAKKISADLMILGNKAFHSDCYYQALSDVIEAHPPGLPGVRR